MKAKQHFDEMRFKLNLFFSNDRSSWKLFEQSLLDAVDVDDPDFDKMCSILNKAPRLTEKQIWWLAFKAEKLGL